MKKKNEEYVNHIWHFKVEDNLDWRFCAGILKQDGVASISGKKLETIFKNYFKENMGIEPYVECPICGKELLPRESKYGYFIGCSGYPNCRFMATTKNPYKTEESQNE